MVCSNAPKKNILSLMIEAAYGSTKLLAMKIRQRFSGEVAELSASSRWK